MDQSYTVGNDPSSKILGILGMDGIGRAVREQSKALGFKKIIYNSPNKLSNELADGAEYVSFENLLASSDIIIN
ncbi:hypothetical protein NADFUDRAFT_82653 [Nadsonia fulvescens var. elongata DSM 6958]|uniref:D-isomer specific 2-hydroxyacid dehydrogenase NAD-binding domain-containing protein n=1 Tax=Nadsonia fulvescens var. elongata DSM 6958 TaxID=857566 RepID=A0A1E3PKC6_9ASCO|nr:hypothetical protein NADFUDRAFT_82653 [Nadsonia fulvescens var. elongata DSM 6958]